MLVFKNTKWPTCVYMIKHITQTVVIYLDLDLDLDLLSLLHKLNYKDILHITYIIKIYFKSRYDGRKPKS